MPEASSAGVPSASSRPWSMITTWSASRSASASSWVVRTTQTPRSRWSAMTSRTAIRPSGSTPAVGSSRKSTSGRPPGPGPATAAAARRRRAAATGCGAPRRRPTRSSSCVGVLGVVVVAGEEVEHLGRAEHRVDAAALEHHADPGHQGGVVADRVEPEDPDRARRRPAGSPRGSRPWWSCRRRSGPSRATTSPGAAREGEPVDGHGRRRSGRPGPSQTDGRGVRRAGRCERRGRRRPRVVTLPLCPHDRHPAGARRHRRR